ncbi:cobalt-precorrin-5B (C(1))-methyltransferase CbiD [Deferribacterales bacterium RsTz2092]|nr:cobalt-precorrin-5B C(1)-methyltransferase [Deferribacterales bacterium]
MPIKSLNSNKNLTERRTGWTTGTTATAATVATVLDMLTGETPDVVSVELPAGEVLEIPIIVRSGKIGALKDAGGDVDATDGVFIYANISKLEDEKFIIEGGDGVGRVTKRGLSVPVGQAAINPAPRKMIEYNVRKFYPTGGLKVVISAENGAEIAKKTFNERLGIVGGISILGTTGFVEYKSERALIDSIKREIDVVCAEGAEYVWLVPGHIGENALKKVLSDKLNKTFIVQMSNFAGESLTYMREKGYKSIGLAGHAGKLAKLAMGYPDTHSARSPQANEYVQKLFGLERHINTIEEVSTPEYANQFQLLACEIATRVRQDYGFTGVNVRLFNMEALLLSTSAES